MAVLLPRLKPWPTWKPVSRLLQLRNWLALFQRDGAVAEVFAEKALGEGLEGFAGL